MICSRTSTLRRFAITCVCAATTVALLAELAIAQTARQRGTFTVSGSTIIGIEGLTTGILDDDNPNVTKLLDVQLSPQTVGAFETSYSGTVTADISFDSVTKQITAIHIANANLVAGNSGNWVPGNWDPNKYAPNGKDWDPGETPPQGQLGGFPNSGTDQEAANYGGTVAGLINFATRNLTLSVKNQGTVFPVAVGGNFNVTTAQKVQFTSGNNALFSAIDNGDLVESNNPLTDFRNVEIDPLAVQPATFTYLDSMGNPQMLANPQAGQPYPSSVVWRMVTSNTDVPVFDGMGMPVYNTPGDPGSGQVTRNVRTYGDLAPAFETTKGGLQSGSNPPNLDQHWFQPLDGEVAKPDVVRLYTPSTTEFDAMGDPIPINGQLEMGNPGNNYSDAAGTVPVSSNITSTFNSPNNYTLDLAMNMDATAAFFVGDFAVSLKITQARDIFQDLIPGTGRVLADSTFSLRPGDVNNSGFVDIFDVNAVSANWSPSPQVGPDRYAGDANGDGFVDIFDVNMISANWAPAPPPGAGSAVPEPSTLLLAALGAVAAVMGLRRR